MNLMISVPIKSIIVLLKSRHQAIFISQLTKSARENTQEDLLILILQLKF